MFVLTLKLKKLVLPFLFISTVILTLINFWWLKSLVLGVFLFIFWIFGLMAGILGKITQKEVNLISQKAIGVIIALAMIIFTNSLAFYLSYLNNLAVVSIFILLNGIILIISIRNKLIPSFAPLLTKYNLKASWLWQVIYLICWLSAIIILFFSQTGEAILSPWQKVPKLFFVIYLIATLVLVKIIFKLTSKENKETKIKPILILISLHYFLSLSIAVIVYKIGYGFDAFVHRAAEIKLMQLGYILPKPLYYAGQYSLVVFLSKLFVLPLSWIDKIMLPATAAVTLPGVFYFLLKQKTKKTNLQLIAVTFILVILIKHFFYSLPQNLANLFLLIFIIYFFYFQLVKINKKISWWQWLLLATIFLIHPLSAVAALIYLIINLPHSSNYKLLNLLKYFLAGILAPVFFIIGSYLGKIKIELSLQNLNYLTGLFKNSFSYLPFYSVYHLVYLLEYNWIVLYGLIFVSGIYFMQKKGMFIAVKKQVAIVTVFLLNLILLSLIKFGSLINYEQGEFIKRWGQIIVLVTLPVALYGVYFIFYKLSYLNKSKWLTALLSAALLTVGLYLAYPHDDAFVKARGYSVSQDDLQAVRWINNQARGDYVVLANQSVSAAALQGFGFKKYYVLQSGQKLFYYPLPTSSPLYSIYLKMVYQGPKIKYINQARQLTGTDEVYFVINSYWLDAKKIIQQAKKIAVDYRQFNGHVWVFSFK